MKICIPTADDRGPDSRLHDHFGSAPFFAMADTESGHIDMVRNTGHHHEHGHCKPITHMDVGRTDAVVCRGMGRRAFALLRDGGLDVWITSADTVRDALADAREGRLRRLSLDSACSGHGAGHAHGA